MSSAISIKEMFVAGVHFGHKTRFWNPQMKPYIYGKRNELHIINLDKTVQCFGDALNFISKLATHSNKILFVSTKRAASKIIQQEAVRCGMPYVNHRWLGGMLTNYKTVRESIKRFVDLEAQKANGKFDKMIKKEALKLDRELGKLQQSLGGFKDMVGLPDALFVIDVGFEKIAVQEANKLGIPVIGVVDTNNSPDGVDYVIPGNDDSIKSIELYARLVADTILATKESVAREATGKLDEYLEVPQSADSKSSSNDSTVTSN
jgi:small subunit ribosomal protein S2